MSDASLTRFWLDGTVSHENGQQLVNGKGLAGDLFERVYRNESHGFASVPIRGGLATLFQARGHRDSAYLIGGENPSLRPVLPQGGSALYDQWGGILKWVEEGVVLDTKNRVATFSVSGWTVNAPEGVTINGDLQVNGNINASGSIIDAGGNTNHHTH